MNPLHPHLSVMQALSACFNAFLIHVIFIISTVLVVAAIGYYHYSFGSYMSTLSTGQWLDALPTIIPMATRYIITTTSVVCLVAFLFFCYTLFYYKRTIFNITKPMSLLFFCTNLLNLIVVFLPIAALIYFQQKLHLSIYVVTGACALYYLYAVPLFIGRFSILNVFKIQKISRYFIPFCFYVALTLLAIVVFYYGEKSIQTILKNTALLFSDSEFLHVHGSLSLWLIFLVLLIPAAFGVFKNTVFLYPLVVTILLLFIIPKVAIFDLPSLFIILLFFFITCFYAMLLVFSMCLNFIMHLTAQLACLYETNRIKINIYKNSKTFKERLEYNNETTTQPNFYHSMKK